jgi:hypothetical protein
MCGKVMQRLRLAALVALVVAASAPLAAQTPEDMARALGTVMNHRQTYMDDPLRFDACSVQRALGGGTTADIAARLAPMVRGMLDDAMRPCPRIPVRGRSVVLVDSVLYTTEAARVYLTVLRGELIHRENYELHPERSTAAFMGVREVRSWGHSQAYPGRGPAQTSKP